MPAFSEQPVTVFAAASLKSALDDIIAAFGPARVSYGGSGTLARQILLGAPADLFLSANTQWMDAVETGGLLEPGSRIDLLGNRLVLVAHKDAGEADLADLSAGARLAMGFVEAVPAGQYGRRAFEHMGLWDALRKRVVETDSVRAALALVARGEVPYGVVYATDAQAEPDVRVMSRFPQDSHPPIRYPMALTRGPRAAALHQFAQGSVAAKIFAGHGFEVI